MEITTVTGKTIAENHKSVIFPKDQFVYTCDNPISDHSSVVGLWEILLKKDQFLKLLV